LRALRALSTSRARTTGQAGSTRCADRTRRASSTCCADRALRAGGAGSACRALSACRACCACGAMSAVNAGRAVGAARPSYASNARSALRALDVPDDGLEASWAAVGAVTRAEQVKIAALGAVTTVDLAARAWDRRIRCPDPCAGHSGHRNGDRSERPDLLLTTCLICTQQNALPGWCRQQPARATPASMMASCTTSSRGSETDDVHPFSKRAVHRAMSSGRGLLEGGFGPLVGANDGTIWTVFGSQIDQQGQRHTSRQKLHRDAWRIPRQTRLTHLICIDRQTAHRNRRTAQRSEARE
jgi:hypothetical protein